MGVQDPIDSLQSTPIAIIGLSCRLPGSVSSPEEFWRFCCQAGDAWSEIPPTRFSAAAYYHPDAERQGSTNVKGGHFLQDDIACFDARFFGITADEARALDPQQRLMLECAYEALENAGLSKKTIAGQDFGVFAAGSFSDYEVNNFRDLQTTPPMQATGCAASFLSNRLSRFFDLHGPSLTVDTACSSSLSALHLACQSLRCGESSHALVGGCHLNLTPDYFISYSLSNLLADSGTCYPFDQRGVSGYGRGEGASCVILKPLHAALADGDPVRAVILNTGINQDGRTRGVGVPSAVAQEDLIRSLYSAAGIDTEQTGYVEAHGTGTKTGDPIEARALHRVFGCQRARDDPLLIGSVKSNIGHAEGASGIISVVKTAMMLEKGFVLPNCDFSNPRDEIPLGEWGLKVPTELTPWPPGKPVASINNFGLGGTNAHAILARAPSPGTRSSPSINVNVPYLQKRGRQPQRIFILSAHTEEAARLQAKSLCSYVQQCPGIYEPQFMPDLAHTLGERRTILPWKLAVTAKSPRELVSQLSREQTHPRRPLRPPSVGFVFCGQGAQWHGMGRELFDLYPAYAQVIRAADEHLVSLNAGFSLVDELFKDEHDSSLLRPTVSQTACTSVQLALTTVLSSWGIHPQATIGHSSGEIAAAHAAGIIGLRDAIALAYARGAAAEAMGQDFPQLKGGMIVLNATLEDAEALCRAVKDGQVSVACVNSPQSITVSGCESGIQEVERMAESRSLFHRKLRTSVAYHSHHMKLVADKYLSAVQDIRGVDSQIPFYSSTRGCRINGSSLQSSYWVDSFVSPVQFVDGLTSLLDSAVLHTDCLVEVGPSTPLEGSIRDILKMSFPGNNVNYVPSLRRGRNSVETLHNLATEMFLTGQPIRLQEINFPFTHTPKPRVLTDLPRYPWDHGKRYWHHSRVAQNTNHPRFPRHDLIGSRLADGNDLQPQWRIVFRADDHPWIRSHQFQGQNIFPIAGFVTMAVEAALQGSMHDMTLPDVLDLREISVTNALIIPDAAAVELMVCLRPQSTGTRAVSSNWNEFQIYSWTEQRGWHGNCHGLISTCREAKLNPVNGSRLHQQQENFMARKLSKMRSICEHHIDHDVLYSALQGHGMRYENSFRTLRNCYAHGGCAVARADIQTIASGDPTKLLMHPATLDVCLQTIWLTLGVGRGGLEKMRLPAFIKKLTLQRKTLASGIKDFRLYGERLGRAQPDQPTNHNIWVTKADAPQEIALQIEDLVMKPILERPPESNDLGQQLCYVMQTFPCSDGIYHKGLSRDAVYEGAGSTETNGQGQRNTPIAALNVSPDAGLRGRKITIVHDGKMEWFPLGALAEELQTVTGIAPAIRKLDEKSCGDEDLCIFTGEAEKPLLANLTPHSFESIQSLLTTVSGVLWIVRGDATIQDPAAHMAIGLARAVRAETGLPIATLDVDFTDSTPHGRIVHGILSVLIRTFGSKGATDGLDLEFISREGVISVPRLVPDVATNAQVYKDSQKAPTALQPLDQQERLLRLAIREYGMLNSLYFTDSEENGLLEGDDLEIQVHYVGLNFKDVMYANNQLAMDGFGIECSGIVTAVGKNVTAFSVGNRVCAISEGCFANTIRCRSSSAWIIPDEMALDIGSTVPVVYCTAFYCLHHVANLKKGESILIHAAAGGVGQAAISLAQAVGATILVTVGSAEKKQFLMDKYALQESQIFYSRDLSFVQGVEAATEGKGVDVLLNSLAGEAMQASIKCVAPFGRFVEIGKRDILANSFLELAPLEHNISFTAVDLGAFAGARPDLLRKLFESVFGLFRQGIIQPISPINTFNAANIGSALQTLQSGRSIGKLVASLRNGPSVKVSPAMRRPLHLNPDASYVVIGGLGGLGQSIIAWLADNGAHHIVITTRRDEVAWSNHPLFGNLQSKGVTVRVIQCDICDETQVTALGKELSIMHPVAGVIHSAMVLRDTIFEQMTFDDYEAVIRPKVHGLWHLSKMLSRMGSKLDFFIALSSVAGIIGNRGQAAYSAASTFLDAFAASQRAHSIPFTTIDLAPVRDIGYLANDERKLAKVDDTFGGQTIDESQFRQLLSAIVFPHGASVISNCHIITGLAMPPEDRARKRMEWLSDPKFSLISGNPKSSTSLQPLHSGANNKSLIELIKTATTRTDAVTAVRNALTRELSEIIMCSNEDIECSKPITTCGIDSLSAIGIRKWLSRELQATLSIFAILNTPSITELVELCLEKSTLIPSLDSLA